MIAPSVPSRERRGQAGNHIKKSRAATPRFSTSREIELSPFGSHAVALFDAHRKAFRSVRVAAIPTSDPTVPQFFEAAARLPESTPAHAKRFLPQSALLGRYLTGPRNNEHAATRVGSIATHNNNATIPVMRNKSRPAPRILLTGNAFWRLCCYYWRGCAFSAMGDRRNSPRTPPIFRTTNPVRGRLARRRAARSAALRAFPPGCDTSRYLFVPGVRAPWLFCQTR
jgi:hypothetical protein